MWRPRFELLSPTPQYRLFVALRDKLSYRVCGLCCIRLYCKWNALCFFVYFANLLGRSSYRSTMKAELSPIRSASVRVHSWWRLTRMPDGKIATPAGHSKSDDWKWLGLPVLLFVGICRDCVYRMKSTSGPFTHISCPISGAGHKPQTW